MNETPEILSMEQAAEFLQVSTRTIQRLVKAGEMPGRQVGTQWRFDRDQLREWVRGEDMSRHEKPSQSELVEMWARKTGLDLPQQLIDFQRSAAKRNE